MRNDLKHLKWKLIRDGLTADDAQKRITTLMEETKKKPGRKKRDEKKSIFKYPEK